MFNWKGEQAGGGVGGRVGGDPASPPFSPAGGDHQTEGLAVVLKCGTQEPVRKAVSVPTPHLQNLSLCGEWGGGAGAALWVSYLRTTG